ncbi:MAG: spore cortex biosynthesis protein YabQ [Oscillospiraceae bacterium]|nr:spore cortex biosynthesis protein YabQ [Oscillospiraceae bacterium]
MNVSIADCLAIAFAAGFIFGIVYEIFRIIRLILQFKAAIFVCDMLFFIAAAFAVVGLSENLGNYIRIYTVIGFGAGVFAYITTIGRVLNLIESGMAVIWRKTLGKLVKKLQASTAEIIGKIAHKAKSEFVKISENMQDNKKKLLNNLHLDGNIVYNKERSEKIGEGENKNVIKAVVKRGP